MAILTKVAGEVGPSRVPRYAGRTFATTRGNVSTTTHVRKGRKQSPSDICYGASIIAPCMSESCEDVSNIKLG